MKRKLFTALVICGAMALTACQEDATMNDLVVDVESNISATDENGGAGGDGDNGNGSGGVGSN